MSQRSPHARLVLLVSLLELIKVRGIQLRALVCPHRRSRAAPLRALNDRVTWDSDVWHARETVSCHVLHRRQTDAAPRPADEETPELPL